MLRSPFRREGSADSTCLCLLLVLALLLLAPAGPGAADSEPDESDEPEAQPAAPVHSVGDVTVTATRAERDVLEVPGSVTVIDREEIERSGVVSIPELLRRQQGIFVFNRSTSPADTVVEARGFNNGGGNGQNLLVQVDGRRVLEPDSDFTDWALLPLDAVETIEIVRGSTSAIYGDNATAGVINIRTRPGEGPPRARLEGGVGSWSTGGGSLDAAGSSGPLTASLGIEGLQTDAYRKQADFWEQNYGGTVEWALADLLRAGVQGRYHRDFRSLPGGLTEAQIEANGRRSVDPNNLGDETDVWSGFVNGWLELFPIEGVQLSLRPWWRTRSDDSTLSLLFLGAPSSTDTEADKLSTGADFQAQVDLPIFGHRNRFMTGIEFFHDERTSQSRGGFDLDTDTHRNVFGVFVQEEFNITDTLLLSAGARYDRGWYDLATGPPGTPPSKDAPCYAEWSPKAALTWRVLPELSVYGSYAHGFRMPSLDESAPFFGAPPDLDAQTSNSGEIGARYRTARLEASLALFLMMVDDEIVFDGVLANQNLGFVRHRGIETAFQLQITEWLSAYANYTFDDVRILDDPDPRLNGARMPVTPEHRGTVGLVAQLPYDVEIAGNANIVGERILANDFDRQLSSLDPYGTFDLFLAWRPSLGEHVRAALTFALRNVTGEEYEDFGIRDDFVNFPAPEARFYPAPTRSWEVGIQLTVSR
jgi:outer membrane receptor protein involved in Fe transport